jgi:hypothetical protein
VATPTTAAGDGLSVITVTAQPTEGGNQVDAVVHFTLLVQAGVPDQPTYAAWDGATGAPTKIDVTATQGVATATVKAPRQGFGTVLFTVSFSSQGKEPTATTTVTLSPSGGAAANLTFTCQHQNVGGLVHGRLTDIHVLCRATAVDISNHPIPTTCTSAPFGSSCQGEPCWTDPTGPTHNPRDGIATLRRGPRPAGHRQSGRAVHRFTTATADMTPPTGTATPT